MRYPGAAVQLGLPFDSATLAGAPPPPLHEPVVRVRHRVPVRDALEDLGPVYFVRHRRARRYLLRVDPDGRVRVTIPARGSQREAERFAARHGAWVQEQRARLVSPARSTEERERLRLDARATLPARVHALAREHGITVTTVSIRNQKTRWGSCARGGRVCLNWRLLLMPTWVADYVIVHELMHVRRMDHSPRFWALVAAACPAYREARAWLRLHGPSLR